MPPFLKTLRQLVQGAICALTVGSAGVSHAQVVNANPAVFDGTHQLIVQLVDTKGKGPDWTLLLNGWSQATGQTLTYHRPMSYEAHVISLRARLPIAKVEDIANTLMRQRTVKMAMPDYNGTLMYQPNDPLLPQQIYTEPVGLYASPTNNAQSAWNITGGGSAAVRVAVLDTGITAHPDLVGQTLPGRDFISTALRSADGDGRDADPTDTGDALTDAMIAANPHFTGCSSSGNSWHGTKTTGIVHAHTNNNLGMAGLAWGTQMVPVRVAGRCGPMLSDTIDAMRWAAGFSVVNLPVNPNRASIINLSLGYYGVCHSFQQTVIDELHTRQVLVVAAAGNGTLWGQEDGATSDWARCNGTLAVGAHNQRMRRAYYSSTLPHYTVDLTAPSGDLYKIDGDWEFRPGYLTLQGPTGYSNEFLGTSYAAPQVTAAAALLRSCKGMLRDEVMATLVNNTRPHATGFSPEQISGYTCDLARCGSGMLDIHLAVQSLGSCSIK